MLLYSPLRGDQKDDTYSAIFGDRGQITAESAELAFEGFIQRMAESAAGEHGISLLDKTTLQGLLPSTTVRDPRDTLTTGIIEVNNYLDQCDQC
jgi:hypothetical protein